MKNGRGVFYIVFLALLLLACAKEKHKIPDPGGDENTPLPDPPIGTCPTCQEFDGGAETTLELASTFALAQFANHPINNPENVRINVNFDEFSEGRFGGYLIIAYTDNGVRRRPSFGTGGANRVGSLKEIKYNIWFENDCGTCVFHAFLEDDEFGAVILVIDDTIDFGDGTSQVAKVGGSVWFKNFEYQNGPPPSPHPPSRCWFVELGPYDCRSFLDDGDVETTSSVEPTTGGYTKLGTFTNLNRKAAFNE